MSELDWPEMALDPVELLVPFAERIIDEPDFDTTTRLTDYELETLEAVCSFAGALGINGREYVFRTHPETVLQRPGLDGMAYMPGGENEFVARFSGYDIKKVTAEADDFRFFEVGLYMEGVRFSQGEDSEAIEEVLFGKEGELFVPVRPDNSIIFLNPRHS